jgi:NAD-dependent dihydropyrimidine dehydrogenase PreA subunit
MPDRQADRRSRTRARWVRWSVLGAVLAGMTAIVTAHQTGQGSGRWASVDFLCPLGGLETLYSLLAGDGFLRHTATSSVILLAGMVAMALVYRRSFCGTLCPLGALQGIFGAAGRTLFGRRFSVPRAVDRIARYLKYAVLVVFALWTWQAAELVIRPYDPWVAWAHLTSADLLATYGIGLAVLVVSLAGSVVYDRFFCKYLCPAGALLALLSRVSFLSIRRDADACIDCGRCDKACMMNIKVATADVVRSSECISCNECVNACPVPGALKVTAPGGARATSLVATGAVVALMAGTVGATTLSGSFAWKSPGMGGASAESRGGSSGNGSSDLMLIKGSTTLNEVTEATGITGADFTAEFGVPAKELGSPLKDIKDTYGFTPEDVRAFVEARAQQ